MQALAWSRAFGLLAAASACLASPGCGGAPAPPVEAVAPDRPPFVATGQAVEAREPDIKTRTRIGLRRQDAVLRVGKTQEEALAVFPEPRGAYTLADEPPGFGTGYRTRGWGSEKESFGIILYNDRVAFAMLQLEQQDAQRLQEMFDLYARELSGLDAGSLAGAHTQYRFWEEGPQRLMVHAYQTPKRRLTITVAMGDKTVMDRLRMNPEYGKQDTLRANQIERDHAQREQGKTP